MSNEDQQLQGTVTDWVNCPICGETDMKRERHRDGASYIFCVNTNCKSNGGDNMNAIELPPAPIPAGQEIVPTAVMDMVGLLVQISDGLIQSNQEVDEAESTLKGVSGAAYFLALGPRDEATARRTEYYRMLNKATAPIRTILAKRAAVLIRKAG